MVLVPPIEKRRYKLEEMKAAAPLVKLAVAYAGLGMWKEAMLINAAAYGYVLGYPRACSRGVEERSGGRSLGHWAVACIYYRRPRGPRLCVV